MKKSFPCAVSSNDGGTVVGFKAKINIQTGLQFVIPNDSNYRGSRLCPDFRLSNRFTNQYASGFYQHPLQVKLMFCPLELLQDFIFLIFTEKRGKQILPQGFSLMLDFGRGNMQMYQGLACHFESRLKFWNHHL